MEKDPVCGMMVDPAQSLKAEYKGKTYYFCAPGCRVEFLENPEQYLGGRQEGGHDHSGHQH